ncbi:LysR family transcriptional regulator [Sphingobium estronivorans]|uniref:LysR family transcriptional regulator n=1 Tax=Sphingobium estronivorans TaxID=1577690 RepID=UPI001966EFF5
MSIDLRQLRYFITILERGSLARAATSLNVAQPALSHHVRNMEAYLGTRLLLRGPKGVRATEAGETLARHARTILGQLAAAEEEIRGHEREPAGDVRLALPGTISEILAVPLLSAVRENYPKVKLRIAEAMSGFVLEWMRQGRADLGVIYSHVAEEGLSTSRLLDEELVFFGRTANDPAGIAASGDAMSFAQLCDFPLIVPGEAHGLRHLLDAKAEAAGISCNIAMEVDAYSNIKSLVEAGFGYSVLPLNAIKQEVASGSLTYWRVENPALQRSVNLLFSVDRPATNAVAAVVRCIYECLRDLPGNGGWMGVANVAQPSAFDLLDRRSLTGAEARPTE